MNPNSFRRLAIFDRHLSNGGSRKLGLHKSLANWFIEVESPAAPNKAFKPLAMLARTLCTPHLLRMPSASLRSRRSAQSAA